LNTYIIVSTHRNFTAAQLDKDCRDALKNYYESRDNLVSLYSIHQENLKKWLEMDRSPRVDGTTKLTVFSVYNHNTTGGKEDCSCAGLDSTN